MTDLLVILGLVLAVVAVVLVGAAVARRSRRTTAFPRIDEEPPLVSPEAKEAAEAAEADAADRFRGPSRPGGGHVRLVEQSPEVVVEAPRPRATTPPAETRPTLKDRLAKSRKFLSDKLFDALRGTPTDETWEDLEAVLIQADIGVEVVTPIVERLRDRARTEKVTVAGDLRKLLAAELLDLFDRDRERALSFADVGTSVWLVVGVNGTGKTTTIGKLASDLKDHGRTVSLAAADTFRAAADEQLGVWAERAGAQLIKHQPGADPGAVAFDAVKNARAKGIDVLIVDTAGRLHNKAPLMDELAKVRRVIEKEGSVDEVLLVIDATAGQNGLVQARQFAESAGVTGIVLTKLDGTAKGGIAIAIEETLGLPIKLIGVGEGIEDLEPFVPDDFIAALLS
ncbi:MAG: signal recognition particle-docking protein FtsY [Actinobacteria bacterium]|nr:signal recognition particle-docking protein FtsY [Actinomycetota bacterium]